MIAHWYLIFYINFKLKRSFVFEIKLLQGNNNCFSEKLIHESVRASITHTI